MPSKKSIALVAAVLTTGLGGLYAAQSGLPAQAAEMLAQSARFGGGHGSGHGGWQGRGFERLCSERRDARLDDAVSFVESFVDFTPEQSAAWGELTAALKGGSASVGRACAELDDTSIPASSPDKLALLETAMATGLEVVRQVRPAYAKFYASLDQEQQQAIDRLMSRRHGR